MGAGSALPHRASIVHVNIYLVVELGVEKRITSSGAAEADKQVWPPPPVAPDSSLKEGLLTRAGSTKVCSMPTASLSIGTLASTPQPSCHSMAAL